MPCNSLTTSQVASEMRSSHLSHSSHSPTRLSGTRNGDMHRPPEPPVAGKYRFCSTSSLVVPCKGCFSAPCSHSWGGCSIWWNWSLTSSDGTAWKSCVLSSRNLLFDFFTGLISRVIVELKTKWIFIISNLYLAINTNTICPCGCNAAWKRPSAAFFCTCPVNGVILH